MCLQVILTCLFLYVFPSSDLNIVCTYLVLGMTISSIFEFVITYIFYIIDRKKVLTVSSRFKDDFLYKILRIAFPVAVTSYIRSGLSTLKQMLIPFSLERYSSSCEKALSQYGLINRYDHAYYYVSMYYYHFLCKFTYSRVCKI